MSEKNINITPNINEITVTNPDSGVTVNPDPDLTTVIVQSDQTKVIEVQTPGPQGAVGPQGPAGPSGSAEASGPIQAIQYNKDGTSISGSSLFLFNDTTGLVTLTGSLELTGGVTGSLLGTASYALQSLSASFALNATTAENATTATTAQKSDQIYVDANSTAASSIIPTYVTDGGTDGYKNLLTSANPLYYYYRTTNPVTGTAQQADWLYIGGGQNTAGGVFLNSTVGIPSFVYSDGPLHLFSQGYKVQISSSADEIELIGNTEVTGSLNVSAGITGSLLGTASYADFATTASYALNALNSFTNLITTGSVTASVELTNDIFLIKSASVDMFKVNNEGVTVLRTNNTTPSAVEGGMFYSGSGDFFFGF